MPHNQTDAFRQLHQNSTPLCLPNAWDAGSARFFESLGAPAIATTSAGVAWSLGYQDGRALDIREVVALAARMARVLRVPLSLDIENGYSDEPKVAADNVLRLVDLGVAGVNIEDGPDKPSLLAAKIEAIRTAVSNAGADVFINARSDVFLASLVEVPKLIEESVTRSHLYQSVGADGFFLPGVAKNEDISAVATDTSLPLNVMAWPGLEGAAELGKLGVRRLSAGAAIAQALWHQAEKLGREFLQTGHAPFVYSDFVRYSDLQDLFSQVER